MGSYYERVNSRRGGSGGSGGFAPAAGQPANRRRDSDDDDFHLPLGPPTAYLDLHSMDQTSMDSHLPEHNVGYQLLLKMGWSKGKGLGRGGEGRVDPVRIIVKEDTLGVGKGEELDTYHQESTAKRKALDSEKIAEETEAERDQRQTKVQRVEAIKEEIKAVTAAFFCETCRKQYSKISEYEAHLVSYDHHHAKRFKEMKEMSRKGLNVVAEKRRRGDKERAREEKELRKLQEAAMARDRTITRTAEAGESGWVNAFAPSQPAAHAHDENISSGWGKGFAQVDSEPQSKVEGLRSQSFVPAQNPASSENPSAVPSNGVKNGVSAFSTPSANFAAAAAPIPRDSAAGRFPAVQIAKPTEKKISFGFGGGSGGGLKFSMKKK